MNVATKARAAAVHCEAKKDGLRQTQDGLWRVTFTVSPLDMPASLMAARPGTRYLLALVEIGDDEQPVAASAPSSAPSAPPPAEATKAPSQVGGGKASQRKWSELSIVEQVAIRCGEKQFQEWANGRPMPPDGVFPAAKITEATADWFRKKCGVTSRRELATDPAARRKAEALLLSFDQATGRAAVDHRSA